MRLRFRQLAVFITSNDKLGAITGDCPYGSRIQKTLIVSHQYILFPRKIILVSEIATSLALLPAQANTARSSRRMTGAY